MVTMGGILFWEINGYRFAGLFNRTSLKDCVWVKEKVAPRYTWYTYRRFLHTYRRFF